MDGFYVKVIITELLKQLQGPFLSNMKLRASKMAQNINVLTVKSYNSRSVPKTHVVDLRREATITSYLLISTYLLWHTQLSPPQPNKQIHIIKLEL